MSANEGGVTVFLSRLILNPLDRNVRRDLADRHELHRSMMRAFPQTEDAGKARARLGVLYRLETERSNNLPRLYVQSAVEPDWSLLPARYLVEHAENPACRPLGPAYARLQDGMTLSFTLRANPTRKVGTALKTQRLEGHRDNGRRVFLARPDEQLDWLRRKGEEAGFALVSPQTDADSSDVLSLPENTVWGRRPGAAGAPEGELNIAGVTFQGRLRIIDRERFLEALAQGLGPGKAYGFGLLSVAPA